MNDQTVSRKASHMPMQSAPIDRAVSPAALAGTPGVEADLWGLPVGDWLEKAGSVVWPHAKGWLNG